MPASILDRVAGLLQRHDSPPRPVPLDLEMLRSEAAYDA